MKAKYQVAPLKGVIRVDWHMKTLSSGSSNLAIHQTPSCLCSMRLHCEGKESNCSILAVVGVDWPLYALIFKFVALHPSQELWSWPDGQFT